MAEPKIAVHPLVWSKERASWVSVMGSEIVFLHCGASAADHPVVDCMLDLPFQSEATTGSIAAIAIGLTKRPPHESRNTISTGLKR